MKTTLLAYKIETVKKEMLQIIFILASALIYPFLFWKEGLALHAILFAGMLLSFLFFFKEVKSYAPTAWIMLAGTILSGIMVIYHDSPTSKIIHLLSFMAHFIFTQRRELRFLGISLLLSMYHFFALPFFQNWSYKLSGVIPRMLKQFRKNLTPRLIFLLFTFLIFWMLL